MEVLNVNDKKTTTLSGVLMYPLEVGSCALILSQGRILRTSRVVAIHRKKRDEIRFETMNTMRLRKCCAWPLEQIRA